METTVIGSYPKPSYLKLPDWFRTLDKTHDTQRTNEILKNNIYVNFYFVPAKN